MTFAEAIAVLEDLRNLEDEVEIGRLETALSSLMAGGDVRRAVPLLLRVFERFPVVDGFGLCWTIVHLIESVPGSYESALIASLHRAPSRFGVTMVNRILNTGTRSVGESDLTEVLLGVVENDGAPTEVRNLASDHCKRHSAS